MTTLRALGFVSAAALIGLAIFVASSGRAMAKGGEQNPAIVIIDNVVGVEAESYQPVNRVDIFLDFAGGVPTAIFVSIDSDLEITGIDLTAIHTGTLTRCEFRVIRDPVDTPNNSSNRLFHHIAFQSESIHYTFDPPVVVTDNLRLEAEARGSTGAFCTVEVGIRARTL